MIRQCCYLALYPLGSKPNYEDSGLLISSPAHWLAVLVNGIIGRCQALFRFRSWFLFWGTVLLELDFSLKALVERFFGHVEEFAAQVHESVELRACAWWRDLVVTCHSGCSLGTFYYLVRTMKRRNDFSCIIVKI